MDNPRQSNLDVANDIQGQSKSELEPLRNLHQEHERLVLKDVSVVEDTMREQEHELERFRSENIVLRAENERLIEEQESSRRKAGNKALKRQTEDFCDRVAELEEELDTCKRKLKEMTSLRKPCPDLPAEIFQLIFERAIPPHFLMDSSAAFCPNSLWSEVRKQKNSIVNVCRAWYRVGLPFLYENVVFHHVSQLSSLLRTLKGTTGCNLYEMIKTVEVNCYIPTWYMQSFEQQLRLLFQTSPHIVSFTLGQSAQLPPISQLTILQPNITYLVLDKDIGMHCLEGILESASPYLISLHFHAPESASNVIQMKLRQIAFPLLQIISMWMSSRSILWFNGFIDLCEMPSLACAMFNLRAFAIGDHFPSSQIEEFCDFHGAGLRFLQITSQYLHSHETNIQFIFDSCPVLEHITVFPEFVGSLKHPNIKWVDIWTSPRYTEETQGLRRMILSGKGLPALKGVRLLPYYLQELPYPVALLLPPNLVPTTSDTFSIQFLGSGIRHDVGEICLIQPEWAGDTDVDIVDTELDKHCSGEQDWYDTDTDTDSASFVPDSDDGSEDSSSLYDLESGSDLGITLEQDADMDNIETDLPWLP